MKIIVNIISLLMDYRNIWDAGPYIKYEKKKQK